MASYFDLKKSVLGSPSSSASSSTSKRTSYFDLKKRVSPVVQNNRILEEEKLKEARRQEAETKAASFRQEAVEATSPMSIFKGTIAGLNPFSKEGRSNIAEGINKSVIQPVLHPIETARNVGGAVKDFATETAQETAYDTVYQRRLDDENLKTIEGNNKKILTLHEAIKSAQDEKEKARLKRQAETYLKINGMLTDEVGGDLAKKTDLQLAGQALGTALDLTPFLGVSSLGTKVGLKTLEKVGSKEAQKSLAKRTGGTVLGKAVPETSQALTREAMTEGGLYGGLSGLGAGMEQEDPNLKSLLTSTAVGTGLGIGLGGTLAKLLSGLGKKAPRLQKAIEDGKVDEPELERIFAEDGIEGVEEIIKPEPVTLKPGEFAPIAKEMQEVAGRKLTAREQLQAKDRIEEGYTKEEVIDEIINPRQAPERSELTAKPVETETKTNVPDEKQEALDYVNSKSVKFREDTARGEAYMQTARERLQELDSMRRRGISESSSSFKAVKRAYDSAMDKAQKQRLGTKYRLADEADDLVSEARKYNNAKELRELGGGRLNERFREMGIRYQSDYDKWWEKNIGENNSDSYQMAHRPTRTGATADNVSQDFSDGGLPDFYEHPEWYHFGGKEYDESVDALMKIKGKPDAEITIYRAAPKNELRNGDWVTLSKEKAMLEGLAENTPVQKFKVKVKDIEFAGDDITEFGYWGKKISQEKFRVKEDFQKVGIKITDEQEKAIIKLNKELFGDENIKITEQILTPQGQKALGSYRDGIIKIVKGEADVKDTYFHEAFHKYLDVLTTADEQADLLLEARRVSGIKDFAEVEEWLSEKFIGYAKNREGVTGKIKAHFDNVLERIKTYLGNEDKIKKAYSELIAGKKAVKKQNKNVTISKNDIANQRLRDEKGKFQEKKAMAEQSTSFFDDDLDAQYEMFKDLYNRFAKGKNRDAFESMDVQSVKNILDGKVAPELIDDVLYSSTKKDDEIMDMFMSRMSKEREIKEMKFIPSDELVKEFNTKRTTPGVGKSITAEKLNDIMPDEYKINEDYDKITLKDELDRASKEISKDKDEALRKAFSRDERVDRRIAKLEEFSQIAKENGDFEAVNRLFTQANKIGTETAQGLNMLKALYAVNPEYKYMQDVISARLGKVVVGVRDIKKATEQVREMIVKKGKDLKEKTRQSFKVKDAQELLNQIMCK